jgi:hypothetical protein
MAFDSSYVSNGTFNKGLICQGILRLDLPCNARGKMCRLDLRPQQRQARQQQRINQQSTRIKEEEAMLGKICMDE